MNTDTLPPAACDLLRRAAEWRMLELLFQCPGEDWRKRVAELRDQVQGSDLATAADLALAEATEGAYHSLLGPGGPAPAREASYVDSVQLGYLMAELSTCYEAFGFRPPDGEAPDHAAVESAFMGFLCLKQAYAVAMGQDEAQLVHDAVELFRREHLSRLAEPFATALEASGCEYLSLAGKALLQRAGPREKRLFEILSQEPEEWESAAGCGRP